MPSRLPKRPGFIGGFQWTPFACELIALPLLQWVVTEIAAYRVFHAGGFFDGLNAWSAPLYAWHGFPIYEPIAWVFWVLHYFKWVLQTHQPWSSALRWSLPLGYGAFLAAMRVPSLLATVMARGLAENQDEIYGSSHWATKKEMKEANLFSAKPGILVGGYREGNRIEYLYDDSDKHALLVAPTGTGKALPVDTPVLTPGGYIPIGLLTVGDLVIGQNGRPTAVTGVFRQGIREAFRISFDDDTSAISCGDHLWAVSNKYHRSDKHSPMVLPLNEIRQRMETVGKQTRYSIPIVDPIEFVEQNLPIDPYLLGVVIGDGGLTTGVVDITTPEYELPELLKAGLFQLGVTMIPTAARLGYRLRIADHHEYQEHAVRMPRGARAGSKIRLHNPAVRAMGALGLMYKKSEDKFIPELYKTASISQRLALLRGLLDTDGSISSRGVVEYSSSSPVLAQDVAYLARSLGCVVRISSRIPQYTHKGERRRGLRSYRLFIRIPAGMTPFRLKRRLDVFRSRSSFALVRNITSIEPVGNREMICISVDAPDGLFVINDCIVTHNSTATAIPTVLSYRGSMIVLDIKEEIYCNTAGFRQRQGNVCLKWSPTRKEGCTRINPLAFIRIGTDREVSDAEMVARALCQPGDEGETSTHWNDTSSSVVTGLILHECYQARNEDRVPTLANVSHMLSPKEETYTHLFRRIATYPHDPTLSRRWKNEHGELSPTHPVVADKMVEAWQRGEDEGSSVISTAKKRFSLFSDPLVAYSTSDSDFRIEDLVDGPKPVSLYLVIPPNQQERLSNLVRLITLTLLDRLTEEQVAHKHELLFMLDEFAQLGTLKPMKNALSYVRGYGIRFFLIVQNVGQIVSSYGPNNSIVPNCHIMIAYTPSEYQTAKALSDVLGAVTIQHLSYNVSAPPHLVAGKNLSMHVQNTKRDLLSPDEILRLKLPKKQGKKVVSPGEALILIFGLYPIKGWQTFCFFDPKMRAWMKIRPMDQSKLLRKEVKCIAASA